MSPVTSASYLTHAQQCPRRLLCVLTDAANLQAGLTENTPNADTNSTDQRACSRCGLSTAH